MSEGRRCARAVDLYLWEQRSCRLSERDLRRVAESYELGSSQKQNQNQCAMIGETKASHSTTHHTKMQNVSAKSTAQLPASLAYLLMG